MEYALQMSIMEGTQAVGHPDAAMDTGSAPVATVDSARVESAPATAGGHGPGPGIPSDSDLTDAINDDTFLQDVLSTLPGVDDPNRVLEQLRQQNPQGQQPKPKPPADQNKQPPSDKDKPN